MEIETIIGTLMSGFATKIYAAAAAIWMAGQAIAPLEHAMSAIDATFTAIQ